MNRTNVQRVIDYLRALPPEAPDFNMTTWLYNNYGMVSLVDLCASPEMAHQCGTSACIAGHIVVGFFSEVRRDSGYADAAAEFLDLTDNQATHLFYGHFRSEDQHLGDVTVDQAIAELERMLRDA